MKPGYSIRLGILFFIDNILLAGLGYLFWFLVAKLITQTEVGLATGIMNLTVLITGLSGLGLNILSYVKLRMPDQECLVPLLL